MQKHRSDQLLRGALPPPSLTASGARFATRKWSFGDALMKRVCPKPAGVIGVSFGQYILDANPVPTYHQAIGWTVVALMTAQMTAYAVRPPLVSSGVR